MNDADCVGFLQWALPQLHMRWPGFRRVRKQVCKRIQRRLDELGCADVGRYRGMLQSHPEEWPVLDALCRVTVTRFHRDKQVFARLLSEVLPELAQAARARRADRLRVWCAGCASGEEPYTLSIAWRLELAARFADVSLDVLATDADAGLLARAAQAGYGWSAVRNLPPSWREAAFDRQDERYCLKQEFKPAVRFLRQDVRSESPPGAFDLVFCRNLAFTYFDQAVQVRVAETIHERLLPGGVLVLGVRETLPAGTPPFDALSERLALYRKPAD